MVGLRTQLAIERAGLETPHLKRGAPDFYPSESLVRVYPPRAWPSSPVEGPEFQIRVQIFAKPRR